MNRVMSTSIVPCHRYLLISSKKKKENKKVFTGPNTKHAALVK